jgi:hypothetical protein
MEEVLDLKIRQTSKSGRRKKRGNVSFDLYSSNIRQLDNYICPST